MASLSLAERAETLLAAGRLAEARRLFSDAQESSEPNTLFELALQRMSGQLILRDLVTAHELFCRAAGSGHAEAARIHTSFVASGTGAQADWQKAVELLDSYGFPGAAKQRSLIDRMQLTATGDPSALPEEERLSERPNVSIFPALFSPDECDFLITEAEPWLQPSVVIDPKSGRQLLNPIRTSDGMSFALILEGPVIHALNRRIAAATGTDVTQGESLQILRYRPCQEYKPHFDAIAGESNQRILTLLVYLNEGYDGGETLFVRTGLAFKGSKGDALLFRNSLPDGRADQLAQHAGCPVTVGEKLIASRWIRARRFDFPPPRPLLDF